MEIPFRKAVLEDRAVITEHFWGAGTRGCERTFANLFLWARFYHLVWAEIQDTAVFRIGQEGRYFYSYPAGKGDRAEVVSLLLANSRQEGCEFRMYAVSPEEFKELESAFPGMYQIEYSRDDADYVYETEKLIHLSGKKYHSKKNHINQFKAAYPDWSYERITDDNVEECFQMALHWRKMNGCEDDPEKNKEMCVALNSLRLYKELGLRGGLLRAGGQVIAYSMGEPVCEDTFVVHIEKAMSEIRGAYPMINQQFLEHEASGYQYVNREEDMGDEGLRKAKLSYRPVFMAEKGFVTRKGRKKETKDESMGSKCPACDPLHAGGTAETVQDNKTKHE